MSSEARAWVMDVGAGRSVAAGTHHVVEYLLSPEPIGLPLAPAHCPAVLIWREQIIPSVDLARLSPSQTPARRDWHGAVVLAYQEVSNTPLRYGALLVDAAPQETWVSNDMACALPEEATAFQYFTCACFAHQEQAVPVLDTARLFTESVPWPPTPLEPRAKDAVTPVETIPTADANPTAAIAEASPAELQAWRQQQAQQIITETLTAIQDEVGLKRVLLGVPTRDRRSVRAHYYRGVDTNSPLRGFRFEREGPNLFARLVAKPQHIWVHAENRERLLRLVNAEVREMIGESEFFASSIFVRSRLLGMCYGDEFPYTEGLDEHRYQRFKDLCNSMARRLGEIAA